MTDLYHDTLDTDVGLIEMTATDEALLSIHYVEPDQTKPIRENAITELTKTQLLEYFSGQRKEFSVPLNAQGTEFQKRVWRALTTLKYGETCSYSYIAESIDNPKGVRAVGLANGRNPISIIVPCHRVIGKNGTLTGYGGGLNRKAWLLNHERDSLF